jgi:hypothetical protein
VRERNAIFVHRSSRHLGVQRIVLALVVTHTHRSHPRRVDHLCFVTPRYERVVHVPALARRFKRHPSRRRPRPQPRLELLESLHPRPVDDLTVAYLAKRNVARPQIQSYASHDRPSFGPHFLCR